jgi:hypothetical protein
MVLWFSIKSLEKGQFTEGVIRKFVDLLLPSFVVLLLYGFMVYPKFALKCP